MSDYVPFEIQVEIINRLPVKSLLRFRSVSKQWKSLIDSSAFIAGYNARPIQPQRLLVRYINPVCDVYKFVSFLDDESFALQDFSSPIPVKLFKNFRLSVLGSSQGLLCLYGASPYNSATGLGMAIFWNPSIRKSVGVAVRDPSFRKLNGESVHVSQIVCEYNVVGFGVCPTTNDPTIVKFKRVTKGDPRSNTHIPWVAEVFTLSAGCWRIIPSSNPPSGTITITCEQVAIDKFIYWFSFDGMPSLGSSPKNMIMSYDMTTEDIRAVELPDCVAHQHRYDVSISKVWESLAVLEYSRNTNTNTQVCVVWMMDRDVHDLFTKLFTISTPNWYLRTRTLGFTRSGKPILSKQAEGENQVAIAVYEPNSEHMIIKDVGIYGKYDLFFVGSYMETLLLHDQVDCRVYSNIN